MVWGNGSFTYHVLPLKAGLVPDNYVLNASVYTAVEDIQVLDVLDAQGIPQGQEFVLGRLSLADPLPAANGLRAFLVEPTAHLLAFDTGLALAGSTIETPDLLAGQTAWVQLLWQMPVAAAIATEPTLLLLDGEAIIAKDQGQKGYALVQGQPGGLIAQRRFMRIPPGTVGELTVAVQVESEVQPIGEITVGDTDRVFEKTASGKST